MYGYPGNAENLSLAADLRVLLPFYPFTLLPLLKLGPHVSTYAPVRTYV